MAERILVTGGAGFLGSHLCARLVRLGHHVLCLDNFFTGSKANLRALLACESFEILRHDVVEPIRLEVDRIYNLACPASPVHYQHNPVATTKTSVVGALNMLGLAKRLGVPILQASTSEVYGDPEQHPQNEGYWGHVNPIGPRSCYDEGKRCAETLFFDYRRQHHLAIKVARIFNTFGPHMLPGDGRVISNFIMAALKGEPIAVFGSGDQTRSFCYVDDMVEALLALMATPAEITGPINLGNPQEISILELARLVVELTGSTSPITHTSSLRDDPRNRRPDISQAKSLLGWQPKVPLRQGLVQTIAFFKNLLSQPTTHTRAETP